MIKPITKDIFFLSQKSAPATLSDAGVIVDLLDTLRANSAHCVGLAANMIGVKKRIIVVSLGFANLAMVNPQIVRKDTPYETEEGCLSLDGVRKTKRYKTIKVKYQNEAFQTRIKTYTGWTAQIIQHELDHLEGIII